VFGATFGLLWRNGEIAVSQSASIQQQEIYQFVQTQTDAFLSSIPNFLLQIRRNSQSPVFDIHNNDQWVRCYFQMMI
jgi:hypothetical protein